MDQHTMTIKLAAACKEETEGLILKAIEKFERETTMKVESIDFERLVSFADPKLPCPASITIKAMLP